MFSSSDYSHGNNISSLQYDESPTSMFPPGHKRPHGSYEYQPFKFPRTPLQYRDPGQHGGRAFLVPLGGDLNPSDIRSKNDYAHQQEFSPSPDVLSEHLEISDTGSDEEVNGCDGLSCGNCGCGGLDTSFDSLDIVTPRENITIQVQPHQYLAHPFKLPSTSGVAMNKSTSGISQTSGDYRKNLFSMSRRDGRLKRPPPLQHLRATDTSNDMDDLSTPTPGKIYAEIGSGSDKSSGGILVGPVGLEAELLQRTAIHNVYKSNGSSIVDHHHINESPSTNSRRDFNDGHHHISLPNVRAAQEVSANHEAITWSRFNGCNDYDGDDIDIIRATTKSNHEFKPLLTPSHVPPLSRKVTPLAMESLMDSMSEESQAAEMGTSGLPALVDSHHQCGRPTNPVAAELDQDDESQGADGRSYFDDDSHSSSSSTMECDLSYRLPLSGVRISDKPSPLFFASNGPVNPISFSDFNKSINTKPSTMVLPSDGFRSEASQWHQEANQPDVGFGRTGTTVLPSFTGSHQNNQGY